MSRNWSANVSMVYWIAKTMGHKTPSYARAIKIANHFGFQELNRIYLTVKRGGPHPVIALLDHVEDTVIIRKAA